MSLLTRTHAQNHQYHFDNFKAAKNVHVSIYTSFWVVVHRQWVSKYVPVDALGDEAGEGLDAILRAVKGSDVDQGSDRLLCNKYTV